jgi:prophage antirepressor-like protein
VNTLALTEGIRGNPNVNVISESGLYALIFRSRKPEAIRFQKWVTGEVLPMMGRARLNGTN